MAKDRQEKLHLGFLERGVLMGTSGCMAMRMKKEIRWYGRSLFRTT